jgi:hypothetical protein
VDTRRAQRAAERPAPLREVDAGRVGMHGGAPARQTTTGIGDEDVLDRYDA